MAMSQKNDISKKPSTSALLHRTSKAVSNRQSNMIKSKDMQLHKLVFEVGGLRNGTDVAYFSRNMKKVLEGYKNNTGIVCACCNTEISPSQFEAHAGFARHRKPYSRIYILDRMVSLHEFSLKLQLKREEHSAKDNDDGSCNISADRGDDLLCEGCTRPVYQESGSSLPMAAPRDKWYCRSCREKFQTEEFVELNTNDDTYCSLCRGYHYEISGFGPLTIIICDQCDKEYHVSCLKEHKLADLKALPAGEWFCCSDCISINSTLSNLIESRGKKISGSLLDITRKKNNKGTESVTILDDVTWRLLRTKRPITQSPPFDNKFLLSKADAIFHECFDPIVDPGTKKDMISSMVYEEEIGRKNFKGMYCAVLTVNSSVVCAGLFRVFGTDLAELPLVATTKSEQGKGYFQLMFFCIEKLLASLNVRNIVLPATEQAESIWTHKFGFQRISEKQLKLYKDTFCQIVTFEGSTMLGKAVSQCKNTRQDAVVLCDDVSLVDEGAAMADVADDEDASAAA